jgi:hypothetical protein
MANAWDDVVKFNARRDAAKCVIDYCPCVMIDGLPTITAMLSSTVAGNPDPSSQTVVVDPKTYDKAV